MPAYEVMNALSKLGISCAVGQECMGDLFITCLKSGRSYTGFPLSTPERCIRHELGIPDGTPTEVFLAKYEVET